jgi:hypothetical protein
LGKCPVGYSSATECAGRVLICLNQDLCRLETFGFRREGDVSFFAF